MMNKPILVTLTSPSASGKSYLLNYIRDEAKIPCLVSTTTRKPRANEIHGRDYYFISEEESLALEKEDQFAELVTYDKTRYGVTKKELSEKLEHGLTFLIVEPSGIDAYIKPIKEAGAYHLPYYVHAPTEIRIQRMKERLLQDILNCETRECCEKLVSVHFDRIVKMFTEEMKWFTSQGWQRVLFGTASPEENLKIILNDIRKIRQS